MNTFRKASVRVLAGTSLLVATVTIAGALQIGPAIKLGNGRLTIEPSSSGIQLPAPARSLLPVPPPAGSVWSTGIKIDVGDLGRTIARPFEQTAKSLKDPFGYKQKAEEMENGAIQAANAAMKNFQQWVDGWMATLGKVGIFLLGLFMGLLALLIRRRAPQAAPVAKQAANQKRARLKRA
jgi:hypothetical protein